MKQIKDRIARWIYRIIFIIVKIFPVKDGKKHLLIIKTDEIGDYILFRNLFYTLKQAHKYKGWEFSLIGNKAWKQLYDQFDNGLFDNVIWVDKAKLKRSIRYRMSLLLTIKNLKSTSAINCIFSRTTLIDDGIAFISKGSEKIAMKSNNTNRLKKETNWDKIIYTSIIDAGDESYFDPIRNRNFIQKILNVPSLNFSTRLDYDVNSDYQNYFVLFLGAGNAERKWPVSAFTQIAEYTNSKFNLTPMLCSGPGDEADAAQIEKNYGKEIVNLSGKTSLVQLCGLLKNARFLVCVDTGALHIAAALGTPVIGLYSGKFYQRFAPYPPEINDKFYPVYPDFVDGMIKQNDIRLFDTNYMKNNTIKLIEPQKLHPYIDKILQG